MLWLCHPANCLDICLAVLCCTAGLPLQTVFRNSFLDYIGTECSGVDDSVFRLGLGLGPTVSITKLNSTAFYIKGTSGMSFPVTSASDITKVIGQVDVGVSDTVMNCVASAAAGTPGISAPTPSLNGDLPASGSGSSGVGAWVWVLVALGACALIAACAALAWYTKRRRRGLRRSGPAQAAQPAGPLECELGKRLAGSSTSSKGTHPTQDRGSASPPKGASVESSGEAVGVSLFPCVHVPAWRCAGDWLEVSRLMLPCEGRPRVPR